MLGRPPSRCSLGSFAGSQGELPIHG